jgi:hypothetical protein
VESMGLDRNFGEQVHPIGAHLQDAA